MITLNNSTPYILAAPLCGYTTSPFRRILHKFPYDLIFTEMVSVDAIFYNNEKTNSLYHTTPDQTRLGIQLVGSKPDRFLYAVEKLSQNPLFQVFDINCGCPVSKVMKTGGGSSLLKDPQLIYKILHNLTKEFPHLCFSTKIRIGLSDKELPYMEVSDAVERGGASFLTVHGRTRDQIYSGDVNFEAISEIKKKLSIPVIGNGGIFDVTSAKEFLEKTGVDGLMMARGMIGSPWLARDIKEHLENKSASPLYYKERASLMKEHFLLEEEFNPHYAFREFKKSGLAYLRAFPYSKSLRIRLALAQSKEDVLSVIDDFLKEAQHFHESLEALSL